MLNRRARAGVVAAVVLALATTALISTPVGAAPIRTAAGPSVLLPDTSAATAGPVVGRAALTALPTAPQAAVPAQAAAEAAPPPIIPPFLSDGVCTYVGIQKNCTDPVLGSYDPLDNCFWKQMNPQPPAGDPLWQGQDPKSGGKLYTVTCETHNDATTTGNAAATVQFSLNPPLNLVPLTIVQQAIQLAVLTFVQLLALAPIPQTDTAPPNGKAVVGLPVWMWADIPPLLWNQQSTSKTVLLQKLSLSFQGGQVDWDMGDGHHVMCSTPGTAYTRPAPLAYKVYSGLPGPSPDCGYTYQTAGKYGITATVTWLIAFQLGNNNSGTFVVSRTTAIKPINVGELQAVTE
jgi:hypothetical protein